MVGVWEIVVAEAGWYGENKARRPRPAYVFCVRTPWPSLRDLMIASSDGGRAYL